MAVFSIPTPPKQAEARTLTEPERVILREILMLLSEREQQCFMRRHVGLETNEEIAAELKISKSTVQTSIERAQQKIEKYKRSAELTKAV